LSRIHDGGANNVVMPAYALIAICGGIGLAALARSTPSVLVHAAVGALLIAQLVSHTTVTFRELPHAGASAAAARFRATVANIAGDVYIPNNTLYLFQVHKKPFADDIAVVDVLRSHDSHERAALLDSIDDAIRAHRFGAIVQDADTPNVVVLQAGYRCDRIPESRLLRPVDGLFAPRWLCVIP
jgi:hypothetical protein